MENVFALCFVSSGSQVLFRHQIPKILSPSVRQLRDLLRSEVQVYPA